MALVTPPECFCETRDLYPVFNSIMIWTTASTLPAIAIAVLCPPGVRCCGRTYRAIPREERWGKRSKGCRAGTTPIPLISLLNSAVVFHLRRSDSYFTCFCLFLRWGLCCRSGFPGTLSVDRAGLKLRNPPPPASGVLGSEVWTITDQPKDS